MWVKPLLKTWARGLQGLFDKCCQVPPCLISVISWKIVLKVLYAFKQKSFRNAKWKKKKIKAEKIIPLPSEQDAQKIRHNDFASCYLLSTLDGILTSVELIRSPRYTGSTFPFSRGSSKPSAVQHTHKTAKTVRQSDSTTGHRGSRRYLRGILLS